MNLDRIGKYRVVAKVGEGAMGEVYKAHDPLLNRFVALKTISPGLVADPQFRERFIREAQSAARLNHPNIITIYDFGEEGELTYMAMEFLEGTDLREAIRGKAIGNLDRRLEIMEQLCEGVGFAHSQGVIHRDLKPGNIHIQPNGHVKVLDFGLARAGASDMTKTGTVMGTPHYMSPEQLRGQKADSRSDVFSLGAIFYELVAGQRAFDGKAVHEVMQRLNRDPTPLRQLAPATPSGVVAVVERAMAREPAGRYKDAGDMARAVAAAREELAGETLASPAQREDDAERTLLSAAGETVLQARPSVIGTAALDVSRGPHETPRTVRPEATYAGGPATEVRPASSVLPFVAAAGLVAFAAAGFLLWQRPWQSASDAPAATSQDQLGVISDVVVTSKLELARADLDNRDYASAANSAREALAIDAGNEDAKALLARAEQSQRDLEAAVAEARAAVSRNDTGAGQRALSRVMALDPRHSVVGELSQHLNQAFQKEAEDARRRMAEARVTAERVRAAGSPGFAAAAKLGAEAEGAFGRAEFAVATQRFLSARDGFEAARRTAEAAQAEATRQAEAARLESQRQAEAGRQEQARLEAQRRASASPTASPSARVSPYPTLMPPAPTAVPTLAPTANPSIAASLPTPSPSVVPTASVGSASDARVAEITRALQVWEQAYEARDVSALGGVMDLSPQQQKALRDALAGYKSYVIEMSAAAPEFDGTGRARVRIAAQHIVNGRKQTPVNQTVVLVQRGDGWRIVGFEK